MLIFQNALLATFIPDILMLIGYLFCLFAPGIQTEPSTPEVYSAVVLKISATQKINNSTFITTHHDFKYEELAFPGLLKSPGIKLIEVQMAFKHFVFKLSGGLTFEPFSRPPPPFFC